MNDTLDENLLNDLYSDTEEIEIVSKKPEDVEEIKTPEQKKESVVIDTPTLDDLFDEEEEEETKDEDEEKNIPLKQQRKPGRPGKEEKFTRDEALRAAARHLGGIFGVEDEVDFDSLDETGVVSFVEQLAQNLQEEVTNSVRNHDDITRDLFDYKENGGDPLKILENYKKQREVQTFDITKDRGQKEIVERYYKEQLDWSDEEIDEHIDNLIGSQRLEKEATKLKQKYDVVFEKERGELLKAQETKRNRELQIIQQKQQEFTKVVADRKLHKKEAQDLYQLAFGKGKLPDGSEINLIDYHVAKIQQDPNLYLDFVSFVKNKEEYDKSVLERVKNQQADEGFKKTLTMKSSKNLDSFVEEPVKRKFNFNI